MKTDREIENIKNGKSENQLAQGAESTLSANLGREAAYRRKEMTWVRMQKSNQQWKTAVDVLKITQAENEITEPRSLRPQDSVPPWYRSGGKSYTWET